MPQSNCPSCHAEVPKENLIPREVNETLEAMTPGLGNFAEYECPNCA